MVAEHSVALRVETDESVEGRGGRYGNVTRRPGVCVSVQPSSEKI